MIVVSDIRLPLGSEEAEAIDAAKARLGGFREEAC